jgi:Putative Ig domain
LRFSFRLGVARQRANLQAARALIGGLVLALATACGGGPTSLYDTPASASTPGTASTPGSTSTPASAAIAVTPAATIAQVGGVPVSFSATISNAADQSVNWEVDGIPGGNASVGTISPSGLYVSPATMPSPATVTVTAVSAADTTRFASASLDLVVDPPGETVTVSPATATVLAGSGTQVFVATVRGASNNAVTWSVNGAAGGNAVVGTISTAGVYTPPATPPAQPTVTVTAASVEDARRTGSAAVTIVTVATAPPTIAGVAPATAQAGRAYTFTPSASSPRGAVLTFSISNKPSWATFSSSTGSLAGTPASTDAGIDGNITISVSDGRATAALPPFSVTVQLVTRGAATLSWKIPKTRTDGTALTTLAGFYIYYGNVPGTYPNKIQIPNPTETSYVVSNLTSGTYYFVATAYDATGVESPYTNVASKTIP